MTLKQTIRGIASGYSVGDVGNVDRATTLYIYELDSDDEFCECLGMTHQEFLEKFALEEDHSVGLPAGVTFFEYDYYLNTDCFILVEVARVNV